MATRVDGITLDTKELDRIKGLLKIRAGRIVKESAYAVQSTARILAPVDTTALKDSIEVEKKGRFTYWVQDGVDYGIYQELGFHHYITEQFIQNPFMAPAVEEERPIFERNWKRLFE